MRILTESTMLAAALVLLACLPTAAIAGPTDAAKKALERGEFEKAAELFAKAAKADPKDKGAALGFAEASVKAGRQDLYYDALDALGALERVNEKDLEVQVAMGDVNIAIANTKRDAQALKGYFADAQVHFERAIEIAPKCEAATVGLAKSLYFVGDFSGAVRAVDAYLATKPADTADAYYWKGQSLFVEAKDAYGKEGHTDAVKKKFKAALGAYAASTAADSSQYDAWIQLAYSAAWGLDPTTADEAYRKAIVADPSKAAASLKGLGTLYANDKPAYTKILAQLVEAHPKNEHVLLFAAFDHYEYRRLDQAEGLLKRQIKVAKDPASGWYYLGQIAEAKNDSNTALEAYGEALKANSDYPAASGAYGMLLLDGKDPGYISSTISAKRAKALVQNFEKLFKLAPRDPWVRNNLGLLMRDGWVFNQRQGRDKAWDPLLKSGAEAYESACSIIGEWDDAQAATMPWNTRYGYAQVVSDTGLMFQFHPPIKDYEKAVAYYERALEFSDHGYFDAFNNLRKIYAEQEQWEDLYDLAELCSEGLVQADRTPHEEGRAQARGVMKQLLDSGKVSGN